MVTTVLETAKKIKPPEIAIKPKPPEIGKQLKPIETVSLYNEVFNIIFVPRPSHIYDGKFKVIKRSEDLKR